MKNFVHLKDDVVFAYHTSDTDVDIPGDNIIEVPSNGESYLLKKYINGEFVDAPEIKYAVLDGDTVVSIERTYFSSDAKGPIISNEDVKILWKWNGSSFVSPETPAVYDTIIFDSVPVTTGTVIKAVTEEEYAERLEAAAAAQALADQLAEQLAAQAAQANEAPSDPQP
jgi:hypothetical protein